MLCELVSGSSGVEPPGEPSEALLEAWRELCHEVVRSLGGRVVQELGKAMTACFGPPQLRADDPARAVDAALDICDRLRDIAVEHPGPRELALRARAAVHTVTLIDVVPDSTVGLDAAVRLARPMLDAAPSGTVLMSDATAGRVRGRFVVEDLGTRELDGTDPQRIWCARLPVGVASRLGTPADLESPLVGRRLEVELLLDRWQRSRLGSRALLLRGEPGIGKTRMLRALRDAMPHEPHSWIEAQCSAFHRGTAFHPVSEFLERAIRLRRDHPLESQIEAIELATRRAGFPREWAVPLFVSLLSLPLSEKYPALPAGREELRERTLEWLTSWLVNVAGRQAAVVVFEDLQWADASTLELLSRLLERSRAAPILFVLTARSDFEVPWDGVEQIVLPPLTQQEAEELVEAVAPAALPPLLVREIAAQTGGIPLLVEELTHAVIEGAGGDGDPLSPSAVSDSLQGALMARLDRLGSARGLAEIGAVLGREFPERLLEALADLEAEELASGIAELVSAGLLIRNDMEPAVHYSFRHALVRDAVYDSLPASVRRRYHERVAKALEERLPDLAASQPEFVARHFDEAGLNGPAVLHYQRAAEEAVRRSANAEAGHHLRRSLELVAKRPSGPERDAEELSLRVALGLSLIAQRGYADPEVADAFAQTRRLSEGVAETPQTFRAFYGLATYCYATAQLEASIELGERCLRLADSIGDSSLRLLSHHRLGLARYGWGEPERALEHLEQAITLYEPDRHRALAYVYGLDAGAVSQVYSALALIAMGRREQGRRRVRIALADAKQADHPYTFVFTLSMAAFAHAQLGDRDRTLRLADELIELGRARGFSVSLAAGNALRGWARADPGATGEGSVAEMREGLAALERTGMIVAHPCWLGLLADAQRRSGAEQGALESLERAHTLAAAQRIPFWNHELLRAEGELRAARGEADRARVCFDAALAAAREQGAHGFALRAAASTARLLRDQGDLAAAAAVLRPAVEHYAGDLRELELGTARDLLELLHEALSEHEVWDTLREGAGGGRSSASDPLRAAFARALGIDGPRGTFDSEVSEPASGAIDLVLAESVAGLSPRRREVLRLVAKGLTNKEIARVLSISDHTAKAHVAGVLEALDLSNRTEAAIALARYEASLPGEG